MKGPIFVIAPQGVDTSRLIQLIIAWGFIATTPYSSIPIYTKQLQNLLNAKPNVPKAIKCN